MTGKEISINYELNKPNNKDFINIGLIQLSTDHTLESDLSKLLKKKAMLFSTRIFYSSALTKDDLCKITSEISPAVNLIPNDIPIDVMAFGCTSASIMIGKNKLAKLLTKNHPKALTTNPWLASLAAFNVMNIRKVAVFAPYPLDINRTLCENLNAHGIEVTMLGSLGIDVDTKISLITKESMYYGLKSLVEKSRTRPDAIFMSCTNLRVLDSIEEFEKLFDIPIVTSNSALFWHCLNLLGKQPKYSGYGRLLNKY